MLASQQVIANIVARLAAAGTSAGARVYSDRFHPLDICPAVKVVHVDEDLQAADEDITWPPLRMHRLQVDVAGHVRAVSGLDAALAALVAELLGVLEGSQAAASLSPLPGCQLTATGISYQAQADGEAAAGMATVRVEVVFHTASNNPSTLI
jgi:hypothetical protein